MQPKKILASILIITGVFFTSCEKLLNPDPANYYSETRFWKDPPFAEGVLLSVYANLPGDYTLNETATDDAVSNDNNSNYLRMSKGEWSSQFDPMASWSRAYKAIYNINYFLSIVDKVEWSWTSPVKKEYMRQRFTGEAYGMRAWFNFELLMSHGGKTPDGSLLGIILMDKPMDNNSDWTTLKRSSYDACVQMIYDDIDKAMALLPLDYAYSPDIDYNTVFTVDNKGRMSGRILKALKSRVALHIASQVFSPTAAKWEAAADAAASSLSDIGGVAGLSATGLKWYTTTTDADIIWRRVAYSGNGWERNNFPPSLYGSGRTNPTQNLVDAFPALNGYPITDAASLYNSQNPYVSRDPRLKDYIVYKGNTIGTTVINTNTEDAANGLNQVILATRTGYYLKKLLNGTVNLAPNVNSTVPYFYTYLRYTEIFLNYAEAANEAWGPTANPRGYGFTPTSIIAAIRKRGGLAQPDVYLTTVTTQAAMRDLIRNERRIELCFEGFRFWDLRRWNLDLTEIAKGMQITNNVYTVIDVEDRVYEPYKNFGPIPYNELLKNKQLIQNDGWSN